MEREEEYKSRFLTDEQLAEMDEEMKSFDEQRAIYAPFSIYHGFRNSMDNDPALLKIEIARLQDFISFLFDDDDYCSHTTEREAWDEFNQKEFLEMVNLEK